MAHVTNGSVRILQRVKTGDYEHKEVSVDLSFAVAEGATHSAVLDAAALDANNKVRELLGLQKPAEKPPGRKVVAPVITPKTETKTDVAAAKAEAERIVEKTENAATVSEDAATVGDPTSATSNVVRGPGATAASDAAAVTDEEEWTAAREVTDKEVNDACGLAAKRVGGAPPVKALIAKYVPGGGVAREIPQDQRLNFLADLEKLQAKAA